MYTNLALILVNCSLLLLLANLLLWALPRHTKNPIKKYGLQTVMSVYPGWKEADVRLLLQETWDQGRLLDHHPFAQFKNAPHHGKYVTVLEPGFRVVKNQASWPPSRAHTNIFVYGGSTVFSLGVTNEESAASYLQEIANHAPRDRPVAVYNFGVPAAFNSQEMAFLFDSLASGIMPDAAVFLDGLNDLHQVDTPALTFEISRFLRGQAHLDFLYQKVPLIRLAYDAAKGLRPKSPGIATAPSQQYEEHEADRAIARWMNDKRMLESVAATFGFRILLAWQPIPQYHYDLRYHAICRGRLEGCLDFPDPGRHRFGYDRMKALYQQGALGNDFLWLADMQVNRRENFYVDSVHYTPEFNREIATHIYEALQPGLGNASNTH
jgi:hypothetical protein